MLDSSLSEPPRIEHRQPHEHSAAGSLFLIFLSARFSPRGTEYDIDVSIAHPQYRPQISSYNYIQKVSKCLIRKDRYDTNLVEPLPIALRHDVRHANIIASHPSPPPRTLKS